MKNKKIPVFITVVAVALIVFIYFFSTPQPKKEIPCGFQNCHGFDVSCGTPINCELVYQYGDNCRRFVHCAVVNETCRTTKEPRFEECKACVVACVPLLDQDYLKGMECEYKCTL